MTNITYMTNCTIPQEHFTDLSYPPTNQYTFASENPLEVWESFPTSKFLNEILKSDSILPLQSDSGNSMQIKIFSKEF